MDKKLNLEWIPAAYKDNMASAKIVNNVPRTPTTHQSIYSLKKISLKNKTGVFTYTSDKIKKRA